MIIFLFEHVFEQIAKKETTKDNRYQKLLLSLAYVLVAQQGILIEYQCGHMKVQIEDLSIYKWRLVSIKLRKTTFPYLHGKIFCIFLDLFLQYR